MINTPQQLENIDWSEVLEMAKACDDDFFEVDSDNEHYLYEAVMKAVYWDDYFSEKYKNESAS